MLAQTSFFSPTTENGDFFAPSNSQTQQGAALGIGGRVGAHLFAALVQEGARQSSLAQFKAGLHAALAEPCPLSPTELARFFADDGHFGSEIRRLLLQDDI